MTKAEWEQEQESIGEQIRGILAEQRIDGDVRFDEYMGSWVLQFRARFPFPLLDDHTKGTRLTYAARLLDPSRLTVSLREQVAHEAQQADRTMTEMMLRALQAHQEKGGTQW